MTAVTNKPLVVGIDGSDQSLLALDWAVEEATLHGRPLHLVHALHGSPYLDVSPRARQEQATELLDTLAERARVAGVTEVQTSAEVEAPVDALLDASRGAELVIVGSRGHTIVGGWLIGSVSMHVSRHAACAVVVVRSPHDSVARRIVVGVDGSPSSETALAFAFDQASARGAPLLALRAEEPSARVVAMGVAPLVYVEEEHDTFSTELADLIAVWQEKYPDVSVTTDVRTGHATQVLTDASLSAALVVVGSRGRGGFTGALMGSISQGVLHHARSTVVVVR